MISVEKASERILKCISVLPAEDIGLGEARGRVLARNIVARRTQPPVDFSFEIYLGFESWRSS